MNANDPGKETFDELIQQFNEAQTLMAEIANKITRIPGIESRLNGLTFERISVEEFDNLDVKDPNTVYYVYDENGKTKQYIGPQGLGGMSVTAGAIIPSLTNTMQMTIGLIEEEP
jgi:hypothetical protein